MLKGYQQLVDENLVEKRRGRGMYVSDGARRLLLAGERERFLNQVWPQILAVINRLDSRRTNCLRRLRRLPIRHLRPAAAMPKKNETVMAPLIETKNLTKRYGSHVALDNAQLSIEPGRIVGLVGPNGAGKTSALRAILGLTTYEGQLTGLGANPFANALN